MVPHYETYYLDGSRLRTDKYQHIFYFFIYCPCCRIGILDWKHTSWFDFVNVNVKWSDYYFITNDSLVSQGGCTMWNVVYVFGERIGTSVHSSLWLDWWAVYWWKLGNYTNIIWMYYTCLHLSEPITGHTNIYRSGLLSQLFL